MSTTSLDAQITNLAATTKANLSQTAESLRAMAAGLTEQAEALVEAAHALEGKASRLDGQVAQNDLSPLSLLHMGVHDTINRALDTHRLAHNAGRVLRSMNKATADSVVLRDALDDRAQQA